MNQQNKTPWRFIVTRGSFIRLAGLVVIMIAAAVVLYFIMFSLPGKSYTGPLPPITPQQLSLAERLERDVTMLAGTIGERNFARSHIDNLNAAADWLESELAAMGYDVTRQMYKVSVRQYVVENEPCYNIIAELPGGDLAEEIVIIGAHYDSFLGSPGANDNASGVAATLELARYFQDAQPRRTLRFICFTNEEPPMFQTEQMGSLVYASAARERGENIVGMLSLETIGYYSDEPGSQEYPPPVGAFYPDRGDFIGFVGNIRSRRLLREVVGNFRDHAEFPSEGGALFGDIPGVGWSDHWAFWQQGYAGLMITDTAPFRYPHYHMPTDTPDKLDYERMARVVEGLIPVVQALASPN